MVDAIFAFYGVAAAVVSGRAETALHVFTERDVFLLDFVAEGDGFVDAFPRFWLLPVVEKPFKNRERFFG